MNVLAKESNGGMQFVSRLRGWFTPNSDVPGGSMFLLQLIWIGIFALVWHAVPFLPTPEGMWSASVNFITKYGFLVDLGTSIWVNMRSVFFAALVSLGLVYLAVIPFFRPVLSMLSKLRFLSPAALLIIFVVYAPDGDWLKVMILTFAMSVFFMTDMAAEILSVPKDLYDEARTLGYPEWRVTWEVIVLGKRDAAIKSLRVNAGMGWAMLTLVEGLVRNQGGIGAVLNSQEKFLNLDGMFAIAFWLIGLGVCQDRVFELIARVTCKFAFLREGRTS